MRRRLLVVLAVVGVVAAGAAIVALRASEEPPRFAPIGGGVRAESGFAAQLRARPRLTPSRWRRLDDGARSYEISARRQPRRPVRLVFPPPRAGRDARDRPSPVVVTRRGQGGAWSALPTRVASDGSIVAEAPHFSAFAVVSPSGDALGREARAFLDDTVTEPFAEVDDPVCPSDGVDRAGRVRARGDALTWCVGTTGRTVHVAVTNARRYPLTLTVTGAGEVRAPRPNWLDPSTWTSWVDDRHPVLMPRKTMTFRLRGDRLRLRTQFDGLARSLDRLELSADLAAGFLTTFDLVPGTRRSARLALLKTAVQTRPCAALLVEPDAGAGQILRECVGDPRTLGRAFGTGGVLVASWLLGAEVFANFQSDMEAFTDSLDGDDRFQLTVERGPDPVLGAPGLLPNGDGWGTARPRSVYNGGVPAGSIDDIRWTGWGAVEATGTGTKPQYRPEGGYYDEPVRVRLRATRLSTCPGDDTPTYTRLLIREQDRPGGSFGGWRLFNGDLCDDDAERESCENVPFSPRSEDGLSDVDVFDVTCGEARRFLRGFDDAPFGSDADPEPRYRSSGWACEGLYDDSSLPSATWTCRRGTSEITFTRT